MAEYTIDKIEYGGNVYKLQDNVSGYTTSDSDEKLKVGGTTSGSTYYPIVGSGTAAATRQIDTTGFSYDATTSTTGYARITLGNSTAQPTSGSKYGSLRLYGTTTNSTTIVSGAPTAIRTITLPDKTGTVALTDDIPDVSGKIDTAGTGLSKSGTTLNHSNSITAQTTQAVYPIKIDAQGHISAYGNAVTIPTIPSNNVTGSGSNNYLAKWSGTNTLSSTSLSISTSYNSNSDLYGTIKLYVGSTGQVDWKGQLVFYEGNSSKTVTITPPTLTASRTITLPDKTGTIALTSDLPTVPSNIVNTITTTAGAHTAITSSTGAVSFKVPTKTSHLTNDSGFITTDTNTTYTLSGALSSHKFTSTLTAGGSGSGTSTSDFTLAAGTGITITDDTSNRKMTIACSVTNTDTKVSTAAITSTTIYYPVLGSDTTAATTKFYDNTGLYYHQRTGTTSVEGDATLTLGNSTATGTDGNKKGKLVLYSKNSYNVSIFTDNLTAHTTAKFPNKSGTIALTSDLNNYLKKPTDNVNFGWVLHTDGSNDSTYWNPPETFIISIYEDSDNPGTYTLINTPDDIREAWNSGSAFILDLNMYNSSTALFDTYRIMNYAMQYQSEGQSEGYHVLSFNGNINYYDATTQCTTVETIICAIYLDISEQYHTDGEVSVHFNDNLAIDGNMLIPNNAWYQTKNTNGDVKKLCGINSSNEYAFGKSSWDESAGEVWYEGNIIHLNAKTTNGIYTNTGIKGLYKITTVTKTLSSGINANSYVAAANISMTAQSGFNAVGIVGSASSNFRIQPTTHYVLDNTHLFAGFANWTSSNVTSSTTVTFYVLWLKATSA